MNAHKSAQGSLEVRQSRRDKGIEKRSGLTVRPSGEREERGAASSTPGPLLRGAQGSAIRQQQGSQCSGTNDFNVSSYQDVSSAFTLTWPGQTSSEAEAVYFYGSNADHRDEYLMSMVKGQPAQHPGPQSVLPAWQPGWVDSCNKSTLQQEDMRQPITKRPRTPQSGTAPPTGQPTRVDGPVSDTVPFSDWHAVTAMAPPQAALTFMAKLPNLSQGTSQGAADVAGREAIARNRHATAAAHLRQQSTSLSATTATVPCMPVTGATFSNIPLFNQPSRPTFAPAPMTSTGGFPRLNLSVFETPMCTIPQQAAQKNDFCTAPSQDTAVMKGSADSGWQHRHLSCQQVDANTRRPSGFTEYRQIMSHQRTMFGDQVQQLHSAVATQNLLAEELSIPEAGVWGTRPSLPVLPHPTLAMPPPHARVPSAQQQVADSRTAGQENINPCQEVPSTAQPWTSPGMPHASPTECLGEEPFRQVASLSAGPSFTHPCDFLITPGYGTTQPAVTTAALTCNTTTNSRSSESLRRSHQAMSGIDVAADTVAVKRSKPVSEPSNITMLQAAQPASQHPVIPEQACCSPQINASGPDGHWQASMQHTGGQHVSRPTRMDVDTVLKGQEGSADLPSTLPERMRDSPPLPFATAPIRDAPVRPMLPFPPPPPPVPPQIPASGFACFTQAVPAGPGPPQPPPTGPQSLLHQAMPPAMGLWPPPPIPEGPRPEAVMLPGGPLHAHLAALNQAAAQYGQQTLPWYPPQPMGMWNLYAPGVLQPPPSYPGLYGHSPFPHQMMPQYPSLLPMGRPPGLSPATPYAMPQAPNGYPFQGPPPLPTQWPPAVLQLQMQIQAGLMQQAARPQGLLPPMYPPSLLNPWSTPPWMMYPMYNIPPGAGALPSEGNAISGAASEESAKESPRIQEDSQSGSRLDEDVVVEQPSASSAGIAEGSCKAGMADMEEEICDEASSRRKYLRPEQRQPETATSLKQP